LNVQCPSFCRNLHPISDQADELQVAHEQFLIW
jgi:hypothetical protein